MPRLDGPDIAHYQYDQGPVDLAATVAAGCFWFAAKATQSTSYRDPTFPTSRRNAKAAGFTYRGAYHWLSSTTDVAAQAANFLTTVGPLEPGEFVMLDAEESGITAAKCVQWCETVEAVTRRPVVVYSGLYVAGGTIWKSDALRANKRPFIVAAYVSEANLATRMKTTGSYPNYPYHAWQYSSNGPVPGITGRCDMDMIIDRPAFDLAAGIGLSEEPMKPYVFQLADGGIGIRSETGSRSVNQGELDGPLKGETVYPIPAGSAWELWVVKELTKYQRDLDPTAPAPGPAPHPVAYTINVTGTATPS